MEYRAFSADLFLSLVDKSSAIAIFLFKNGYPVFYSTCLNH